MPPKREPLKPVLPVLMKGALIRNENYLYDPSYQNPSANFEFELVGYFYRLNQDQEEDLILFVKTFNHGGVDGEVEYKGVSGVQHTKKCINILVPTRRLNERDPNAIYWKCSKWLFFLQGVVVHNPTNGKVEGSWKKTIPLFDSHGHINVHNNPQFCEPGSSNFKDHLVEDLITKETFRTFHLTCSKPFTPKAQIQHCGELFSIKSLTSEEIDLKEYFINDGNIQQFEYNSDSEDEDGLSSKTKSEMNKRAGNKNSQNQRSSHVSSSAPSSQKRKQPTVPHVTSEVEFFGKSSTTKKPSQNTRSIRSQRGSEESNEGVFPPSTRKSKEREEIFSVQKHVEEEDTDSEYEKEQPLKTKPPKRNPKLKQLEPAEITETLCDLFGLDQNDLLSHDEEAVDDEEEQELINKKTAVEKQKAFHVSQKQLQGKLLQYEKQQAEMDDLLGIDKQPESAKKQKIARQNPLASNPEIFSFIEDFEKKLQFPFPNVERLEFNIVKESIQDREHIQILNIFDALFNENSGDGFLIQLKDGSAKFRFEKVTGGDLNVGNQYFKYDLGSYWTCLTYLLLKHGFVNYITYHLLSTCDLEVTENIIKMFETKKNPSIAELTPIIRDTVNTPYKVSNNDPDKSILSTWNFFNLFKLTNTYYIDPKVIDETISNIVSCYASSHLHNPDNIFWLIFKNALLTSTQIKSAGLSPQVIAYSYNRFKYYMNLRKTNQFTAKINEVADLAKFMSRQRSKEGSENTLISFSPEIQPFVMDILDSKKRIN